MRVIVYKSLYIKLVRSIQIYLFIYEQITNIYIKIFSIHYQNLCMEKGLPMQV